MSISVGYAGTSILQGIQPESIECAQLADMGETATGAFTVEDDAAALTIIGYQALTISESACSQPRLFTGWTFERGYQRDAENAILTGSARTHDVTIIDMNACFGFRQITGTDGNRSAETWAARLTWILGSEYLHDWISSDQTFIVTNTTMMDAADYRGSYPSAVMQDLSDRSGNAYDYFAFWDPAALEVRLFFDNASASIGDSALRISNVLSDWDGLTTFGPDKLAKLTRESDQVYSDVCVNYADGTLKLYRSRPSTYATFVRRSTQIDRPYTRSAATARLQADAWLTKHSVETDRITCTIRVPASRAGLVQAGQRIQFKAPHMPGYEDSTWMRVVMCTPKPADETCTLYDIALELVGAGTAATASKQLVAVLVARNSSVSDVPPAPAPGDGSAKPWTLAFWDNFNDPTQFPGPGQGGLGWGIYYRDIAADEVEEVATFNPNAYASVWVFEVAGIDISNMTWLHDTDSITTTTTLSAVVGTEDSVFFGGFALQKVDYGQVTLIDTTDGTAIVDTNAGNVGGGTCTVTGDSHPPRVWIGYNEGTGTLDLGGTITCTGATPPYNLFGRGYGGFYAPAAGAFSVVQQAFVQALAPGAPMIVTLGSPPTPAFEATGGGGGSDVETALPPDPTNQLDNTTAVADPAVTDDADSGYSAGSVWVNTATGDVFVLVDSTVGAAVWVNTTTGTGFVTVIDGGKETVSTVAASGATETLDLGDGNVHDVTLTADCTLTFAGATAGVACSFTLLLRQDGTGGWDTIWPGSVVWAGGTAPTLDTTASTVSVLTFFTLDGGTVWYGFSTGGTGAPDTVDYLVGTASGSLSAEIVVGTTPGGELGGTWASPTVDATHSGSAHLALGATSSTAAAGDHTHTSGGGELLITDTPAGSPLIFADILQNEAGTDLLYSD